MILGIGCDIIELRRVERLLSEQAKADRIFTEAEQRYCDSRGAERIASYAGRFAVKEAVVKAFGCGIGAVSWADIEVVNQPDGVPTVRFYGEAARLAGSRDRSRMHISLSHGRDYATANAVWEGGDNG